MNLIEQLKIEETKLMEKISNTENEATYRNLIRNLSDVTQLRQREERELPIKQWELKWSKYETKEKDSKVSTPMISVWEQKGDEIRKHRVFEIAREIKETMPMIDRMTTTDFIDINHPIALDFNCHGDRVIYCRITLKLDKFKDINEEDFKINVEVNGEMITCNNGVGVDIILDATENIKTNENNKVVLYSNGHGKVSLDVECKYEVAL